MEIYMNTNHPQKSDFPEDLQKFYITPPKSIKNFPEQFNPICLEIKEDEIDNIKTGVFKEHHGKKVDGIHYSIGIGLIENKTTNYSSTNITNKIIEFKEYFESKYKIKKICQIKYCILKAKKLGDKIRREVTVDPKTKKLKYRYNKDKDFIISNLNVYFVKDE